MVAAALEAELAESPAGQAEAEAVAAEETPAE